MSFSNKVVIVTGGSSGIGAATAELFAKEGADVTIVGRNEAKLNLVAAEIKKHGKTALIVKADVTNDEDVKQIIIKTLEKFGRIDVLVNNAGIVDFSKIGDENFIEVYDKVVNTNTRSIALLTSLAVPHLKNSKGNIVNISSVAGEVQSLGFGAYGSSKAALNQLSRNCAMELAEHGVRVNFITPGPVKTNIYEAAGLQNPDYENFADTTTALRILTMPEEVAEVVVFLASDKSRSVTGTKFTIDAGLTIKGVKDSGIIKQ